METKNQKKEENYSEIINRVLKERGINTMSGVSLITFFWRPNNYRLLIPFNAQHFKLTLPQKPPFPMEISNFGSKYIHKQKNITIILDIPKKDKFNAKITAIFSLKRESNKLWYKIEKTSLNQVNQAIDEAVDYIRNELITTIEEIIKQTGGLAFYNQAKWIRHEDEVKGEDFINSIDQTMVIHDTYFKKVYDSGVEFKSPFFVKKYINNRVVEEIAPEIKEELKELKGMYGELKELTLLEIRNKKLHLKVLQDMRKTLKDISSSLKPKKKPIKLRMYQQTLNNYLWKD
jgi:hypothetical protein